MTVRGSVQAGTVRDIQARVNDTLNGPGRAEHETGGWRLAAKHASDCVCLLDRVRELEDAAAETEARIERGRHAYEMLRHWNADGRPSKVMPWVVTFLREGGSIFSPPRAAVSPVAAGEER